VAVNAVIQNVEEARETEPICLLSTYCILQTSIDAKLDRKGSKTKKFKNFFHKTLENVEKSCIFA
jgi:hypothetical protein